jgi:hypothetical protein
MRLMRLWLVICVAGLLGGCAYAPSGTLFEALDGNDPYVSPGTASAVIPGAGQTAQYGRISQTSAGCRPYVFEQVNRLKAKRARGGRGHHRSSAWAIRICRRRQHIVDKLTETVQRPAHAPLFRVEGHSRACARRRRYYGAGSA